MKSRTLYAHEIVWLDELGVENALARMTEVESRSARIARMEGGSGYPRGWWGIV